MRPQKKLFDELNQLSRRIATARLKSGYTAEQNAPRPTMKQKGRFILRSRGLSSGQIATSEDAIALLKTGWAD